MSNQGRRACVEGNERYVAISVGDLRPPSTSAGTKRTSSDLRDDHDDDQGQIVDPRGLYYIHRKEIDVWYNEQHAVNRGIPQYNKKKHINDPWYIKVDVWMKHKGLVRSPKKKRKLNKDSAISEPLADDRPPRPDRMKYPGDKEAVPEHPFDKLSDFEQMPNGRYACGHVNLDPPHDCCINGITRQAKKQSIKKSVFIWKRRVERLIDVGKLNTKHKTWEDWTEPKLREKYQPALREEHERRKQERKSLQREQEERMRQRRAQRKRKAENGSNTLAQGKGSQPLQKRGISQNPSPRQIPEDKSTTNMHEPSMGHTPCHMAPRGHPGSSNGIEAHVVAGGGNIRRRRMQTEPSLHRSALWNRRRSSQKRFRIPTDHGRTTMVHEQHRTSSEHILIDLTADATEQQSTTNISFEVWNHERLNNELDRILATTPCTQPARPVVQRIQSRLQSVSQRTTSYQSEVSYLTSLPQWCATRNAAVDGEMQHALESAYQTGAVTEHNSPEDERLLCQTIEASRADWQRFYDFFLIVNSKRG